MRNRVIGYAHRHSLLTASRPIIQTTGKQQLGIISCLCDVVTNSTKTLRQDEKQLRLFSSNLLGHSPMAQPVPNQHINKKQGSEPSSKSTKPSVMSSSVSGVWAQTSAKRDKLVELRSVLKDNEFSLDDAASEEEMLDLNLADGLRLVVEMADKGEYNFASDWLVEMNKILAVSEAGTEDILLDRTEFERHLNELEVLITPFCECKKDVARLRDFMKNPEVEEKSDECKSKDNIDSSVQVDREMSANQYDINLDDDHQQLQNSYHQCVGIYRALLLKHSITTIKSSWDTLTAIADVDIDRAAVKDASSSLGDSSSSQQETSSQSLSLYKVNNVLRSYASGSCDEQIKSIWTLLDRDDDSLLEEEEVSAVVELGLKPVKCALMKFVIMALEVSPVRNFSISDAMKSDEKAYTAVKLSWRQKRQETKTKKELKKVFKKAESQYFEIEVEMSHRLRCIYSWADKLHQDGKVQSILVDSGSEGGTGASIMGRKRYVELKPKISYDEFRCMQHEHINHLDRIGTELLSCYRENLLVSQGIGRQNKELRREALGFLVVVSLIDVGINML